MKYKQVITILALLITICFLWTCNDDELPIYSGINKVELTITEDSISYVFSQIACELSLKPKFEIEQHGFCWDTIANTTIEKQKNSFGNLTNQNFQENIESLIPNKTYYVRAYIQNGDIVIYSNEINIQTLDARPVVTTSDVINIQANRAESGGNVEAYAALFPITQRGICWAKTSNPTIADSLTLNETGNGAFLSEMKNLEIGINYHVKAFAINSEGISYGEEKSFSTLDGIPDITTDSIKNITATSATFYGNLIENDGLEILEKGFCWSTNTNPTIENNFQVVTGNTLGSFNKDITGLAVNTTYYVKTYLKNTKGTFYGNQLSFITDDGLPTISTTAISNITAISAESGGNITNNGGFAITARGVCWSTISNPTISDNHTTNGSGTGNFTSDFTNLEVSTTYYVRAYGTNINGTVYGNQLYFITENGIPTLTTSSISIITAIAATSGGNINDDGGSAITSRGVCWSTTINPTTSNDKTIDASGTGVYTSSLTSLSINTTYYVRAYATNAAGTNYGNQQSFITDDGIITLTTNNITGITATTATCGGNNIDDGGLPITARGICWSITTEPTVANTHTIDGTEAGNFTSSLTGLTEWTTYYVRAYATNANGTAYGNEINFLAYDVLNDYDGNEYHVVKIGVQIWLKENLKTTHYADGTAILLVEDGSAWNALGYIDKAICYNNNSSTNKDIYGVLYTWGAAMNGTASSTTNPSGVQGACLDGWHVPSDAEWTELTDYIGGTSIAGGKLKENGTTHWASPNTGATNETGFTALPGGYRYHDGTFINLGYSGAWWSSSELSTYDTWIRDMIYNISDIRRVHYDKRSGLSVRCIKD